MPTEVLPSAPLCGFERLMEVLPAAAYTCDADGLITSFNERAADLWGRRPKLNNPADRYCGSWRLFGLDGSSIAHDRCWMALALHEREPFNQREIVIERPDGTFRTGLAHANPLYDDTGRMTGAVNILVDITERKHAELTINHLNRDLALRIAERTSELESKTRELERALEQIQTLRGMIPICSWCKKIRDDAGAWQELESYLGERTQGEFTHGICPDCAAQHAGLNYDDNSLHKNSAG